MATLTKSGWHDVVAELAGNRKLLSPADVAGIMGVDYKTAYRLIFNGRIKSSRFGGKLFTPPANLAEYLEQNSTARTALEALLQSLSPLDPADYKFRQELDSYTADRAKQVGSQYKLNPSYAAKYVRNEASALLEGKWEDLNVNMRSHAGKK